MTIEMVQSEVEAGSVDISRPTGPWSADLLDGARDLFEPGNVVETLDTVVGYAQRTFAADGVGILLATDGGAASTAASGAAAKRADALQVDHHQGPGFHSMNSRQPVVSFDLRSDGRWRIWAPRAADLGFRSVMSLALTDGDAFGAVTLYSRTPSFFGTESLAPGLRFAQQASIAITVAVEREQLSRVAEARGIVGQAQGILMERYQISADQAFAVIRRASSALNQKLRQVAERIIGGWVLPDLDLMALAHTGPTTGIGSGLDHRL